MQIIDHRAWQLTYNFPTLITDCLNNYGPYQFPERLIPLTILNAIIGKPHTIYGKGDQVRDCIYVDDHAKGLVKVLQEGEIGETYNIGGHNKIENIKVVEPVCNILDELIPIKNNEIIQNYKNLITFVEGCPGHDLRYDIDATKVENKRNWNPTETFETGIKKQSNGILTTKLGGKESKMAVTKV
jgi:dTDP-glucose 4,6-dehydratase